MSNSLLLPAPFFARRDHIYGNAWVTQSGGNNYPVVMFGVCSTTLLNGAPFSIGGISTATGPYTKNCWVFQAGTGSWVGKAQVTANLAYGGCVTLHDGTVLVAGTYCNQNVVQPNVYRYTPGSDTWAQQANYQSTAGHFVGGADMALLGNGCAILMGGANSTAASNAAYIFDPVANSWTQTANAPILGMNYVTAASLPNGSVLFCGGTNNSGYNSGATNTCLVYRMGTSAWVTTNTYPVGTQLELANALVLRDGTVLVVGGGSNTSDYANCYTFNYVTGAWTQRNNLPGSVAIDSQGRSLLPNGSAIFFSSENFTPTIVNTAYVYL